MKLSGHLTIQIVDEITGDIVQTIEQDNLITDLAYTDTSGLANSGYWRARNIFISTETATPVRTKTSIQCSGTAYRGTGQPNVQAFQNADPPYILISQRFDSVVTPRTFQTVGLTPDGPGQVVNTTVAPHAYLLLNSPCTQEANQVLNMFYRITVTDSLLVNSNKPLYPRWKNDICYGLVYSNQGVEMCGDQTNSNYYYNTVADAPLKEYGWKYLYISNTLTPLRQSNDGAFFVQINNQSQNTLFYRKKQYISLERDDNSMHNGKNGRLINGLLHGNNSFYRTNPDVGTPDSGFTRSAHTSSQTNFTSNLQSAFSYSANPRDELGPMFLPDNNPTGTGVIQFSEDPWTATWPTIYRIRITTGGAVGTAKYVLGVKKFTSFTGAGNPWGSNELYAGSTRAYHPYIYAFKQPYDKCHGWQMTMPILALDDKWTVQADWNGLSIINQFTGQHYDFDSTTTPALPITNFRQLAIDTPRNLIYVACSATGLWRLDITNKAAVVITNVSTTPCYAVDVDGVGIVYTFMNLATTALSLTSSASSYTTDLGFTTVALTTSNYLNIYVNKIHADTRIAITVRQTSTANNYRLRDAFLYWWSLAGGNSSNNYVSAIPYCGEIQTSFAWVNGSDNRFWSAYGWLYSFNVATRLNPATDTHEPVDINNAIVYYDTETYKLLDNTSVNIGTVNNGGCRFPPSVCQDQWGYLLPMNRFTTLQLKNPSNGVSQSSYNHSLNINQGSVNGSSSDSLKRVALTNGIVLSDTACAYLYNNGMNNDINKWIWYKWDGTNWVKAVNYNPDTNVWTDTTGTDTKTTSTSFAPLLDGINIRFTNGTTEPSFVVREVYDQYVAKGILKTNDNTLYLESYPWYTQPVFSNVTLTPTTITLANNYGVVLDGAPGNSGLSAAVSAITVNNLWHSILPEYIKDTMRFTIDGTPVTTAYVETINTIPAQNTLTTGQIIVYRNGLILCSAADVNKTLAGYFSYVAKSD
jgi:hypothetical protein